MPRENESAYQYVKRKNNMKEEIHYNTCNFLCEQCKSAVYCENYRNVRHLDSALPMDDESPSVIRAQIGDASFDILKKFAAEKHFKLQEIFESKPIDSEEIVIQDLQQSDDIEYKVESSDCFKILVIYENMMASTLDHIYDWLDSEVYTKEMPIQVATSAIEWNFNLIYINLRYILFVKYGNNREEFNSRFEESFFIITDALREIKQCWGMLGEICLSLRTEKERLEIVLDQLEDELIKTFPGWMSVK